MDTLRDIIIVISCSMSIVGWSLIILKAIKDKRKKPNEEQIANYLKSLKEHEDRKYKDYLEKEQERISKIGKIQR